VLSFGRDNLVREAREHDPGLLSDASIESIREAVAADQRKMLAEYAARLKNWRDVIPAASQPVIFSSPLAGIGVLSHSLFAGTGDTPLEAPENRAVNQRTDFGIAKFAPSSAPATTGGYENNRIHLVPTEGKRRHRTANRRRFMKGDGNARRATA